MVIPRSEYPRPQMVRNSWDCLNGEWDFEFDFSKSGLEKKFYETGIFTKKITVPFCPESKLSGIGFTDFIAAVWYRRNFTIPKDKLNGITLLHFGAVDYLCKIFVNGKEAGTHKGGYSSFSVDITNFINEGGNTVVVYAEDDVRSGKQPKGKQSGLFYSAGCDYTRTTGIWQTVWLEFVPKNYIKSYKLIPDINNVSANISVELNCVADCMLLKVQAFFKGKCVGVREVSVCGSNAFLAMDLDEKYLWDVNEPNLYELKLSLTSGSSGDTIDEIDGYFGLRHISIKNNAIYLNGRPVFQRLVLDQGFYPDGIYTAPSDLDLKKDIELSMSLGFNGARLHQKAFEERFLYHADKAGYLVWGEHANWGLDIAESGNIVNFLPEWLELLKRDFNHPSIVGWCPFNETWDNHCGTRQNDDILRNVYIVTKEYDQTRPVIDTSGNFHVVTDIYDIHDYEQSTDVFEKRYAVLKKGEIFEPYPNRQKYGGQPYFISEYGGTWWNASELNNKSSGWGYGNAPLSEEEVCNRYVGLTSALLKSEAVCAFCYTQLYDIEQEQNGLFTYDRKPKFSGTVYEKITACNKSKSAIEIV